MARTPGKPPSEPDVRLKRAYERPSPGDGMRVLVDRLWPRGVSKSDIAIDRWLRDVAPSTELRRWFGHDPERWDEFRRRYQTELADKAEPLKELQAYARKGTLTLIYAARDEAHNEAVVLRDLLVRRLRRKARP
jgi:uncharacterized protein YeaO (DUF488 family)